MGAFTAGLFVSAGAICSLFIPNIKQQWQQQSEGGSQQWQQPSSGGSLSSGGAEGSSSWEGNKQDPSSGDGAGKQDSSNEKQLQQSGIDSSSLNERNEVKQQDESQKTSN